LGANLLANLIRRICRYGVGPFGGLFAVFGAPPGLPGFESGLILAGRLAEVVDLGGCTLPACHAPTTCCCFGPLVLARIRTFVRTGGP
jgi:hypothetical protein